MTAKEAREYIGRFHMVVGMPSPMTFAEKNGKQYAVSAMTDEDIISLALSLQSWEADEAKKSIQRGASVN